MISIGVAIAVPEPYGSILRAKRKAFGDEQADGIPSHVTLLPPTPLDVTELDSVVATLEEVAQNAQTFDMTLRGTATFRPVSPVVFVAVAAGISPTEVLADTIRQALNAPEPQFPFHPHVTVAHHLTDEQLDRAFDDLKDFSCDFEVDRFVLYRHDDAEGWRPNRFFSLQPR